MQAGRSKSGLWPLRPSRFGLRGPHNLAEPLSDNPPASSSSRTPLATLSSEANALADKSVGAIASHTRKKIKTLAAIAEGVHARNVLLERELESYRAAAALTKPPRAGIYTSTLKTHDFTSPPTYAKICKMHAASQAKKRRIGALDRAPGSPGSGEEEDELALQ